MVGNGIITLKEPLELHYTVKVSRVQLFDRCGKSGRGCTLCSERIAPGDPWGHLLLTATNSPCQYKPVCRRCLAKTGVLW